MANVLKMAIIEAIHSLRSAGLSWLRLLHLGILDEPNAVLLAELSDDAPPQRPLIALLDDVACDSHDHGRCRLNRSLGRIDGDVQFRNGHPSRPNSLENLLGRFSQRPRLWIKRLNDRRHILPFRRSCEPGKQSLQILTVRLHEPVGRENCSVGRSIPEPFKALPSV